MLNVNFTLETFHFSEVFITIFIFIYVCNIQYSTLLCVALFGPGILALLLKVDWLLLWRQGFYAVEKKSHLCPSIRSYQISNEESTHICISFHTEYCAHC